MKWILFLSITVCLLHQDISNETKKIPRSLLLKRLLHNRTLELLRMADTEKLYDSFIKVSIDSLGPLTESYENVLKQAITDCCSYSVLKYDFAQIYIWKNLYLGYTPPLFLTILRSQGPQVRSN